MTSELLERSEAKLKEIHNQISLGQLNKASESATVFKDSYPYNQHTRPLFKQIEKLKNMEAVSICYMEKKIYHKALKKLKLLEKEIPSSHKIQILIVECLFNLNGTAEEGADLYEQLCAVGNSNDKEVECSKFYLKALIEYFNADIEMSLQSLEQLFKCDKDHGKGRELEGKVSSIRSLWEEAVNNYESEEYQKCQRCLNKALDVDLNNKNLNKRLLVLKAKAEAKLGLILEAESACEKLRNMGVNPSSPQIQEIQRIIYLYQNNNGNDDNENQPFIEKSSLSDYNPAKTVEGYQMLLSRIMTMDCYQTLGFSTSQPIDLPTINAAARQLIKRFHPDNNSVEIRDCCIEIFKCIKEAQKKLIAIVIEAHK